MNAVVAPEPPYLRALVPADLDRLAAIEARAYTRGGWSRGVFADCLRVGYYCRGFDCAGELAGYGIVSVAAGESHLLNLAVDPRWQRHGFARLLLAQAAGFAREAGAECMLLEVRPSNAPALGLYSQAGFTRFGRRHGYYPPTGGGESEDALILCLRL
ncbi:MAG: ribosomal protein S18-alanine N-acetyltransferase [Gammaproteobacteria bacterium]